MTLAASATHDSVAHYVEAFRHRPHNEESPAVTKWRKDAMVRFANVGFPDPRQESWRQTDPRPFSRAFTVAPKPEGRERRDTAIPDFWVVDGAFGAGQVPEAWRGYLTMRPPTDADIIEGVLEDSSAFSLLNVGFFPELTSIRVPPAASLSNPLRLNHQTTSRPDPSVVFPRIHIHVGENAEATVVESYETQGDGAPEAATMTNAVTHIHLAQGARFTHVRHQNEAWTALHLGRLVVHQERASAFRSYVVSTGAERSRVGLDVKFLGEGCDAMLSGLFGGVGTQHVDTHTLVDHAQPRGTSRQVYKGILGGSAHGVFHGRVIVRPDAQKTDARQTNKNLLLSDEARVDSTPQLEIRADDVRCTHGSTIGQLDDDALFYLRARGLDVNEGTRLLVHAFAADVIRDLPDARVIDSAKRFIERALVTDVKNPVAPR